MSHSTQQPNNSAFGAEEVEDYSYPQSLDDLIMLLACRYRANPNFEDEEDGSEEDGERHGGSSSNNGSSSSREVYLTSQRRAWGLVAEGMRHHLAHPMTAEEKAYLRYLDAEMFTPAMCINRVQYALWRREQHEAKRRATRKAEGNAKKIQKMAGSNNNDDGSSKAAGESAGASGFSITRHSIRDEVQRLYARVRSTLPSCDDVDLTESDDDEEEGVAAVPSTTTAASSIAAAAATSALLKPKNPFDKVKQFTMKTQAEVDRDIAIAKAEEDLFAQFAALQQDHFKKTRRWVEVPSEISAMQYPSSATASKSGASAQQQQQHHADPYSLMGASASAAGRVPSASAAASPSPARNSNSAATSSTAATDAIQIAKNALNPFASLRPPRPSSSSAARHYGGDDDEDEGDEDDEEEDYKAFMRENARDVKDMLSQWKSHSPARDAAAAPLPPPSPPQHQQQQASSPATKAVSSVNSAPSAVNNSGVAPAVVAAAAPNRSSASPPATASANGSAARSNRWNIVEYEDDDDSDEDAECSDEEE